MSTGSKVLLLSLLAAGILTTLLVWNPQSAPPGTNPIVLYCAAGIQPPVETIAKEYERTYGVEVQLQYGGSGTLLANLQVADSGDLYLAADQSYVDIARKKGLIAEEIPVAYQQPVIAVRRGNPRKILKLSDLLRDDVKLALGNPDAASIGKQTRSLLETAGMWNAIEHHVKEQGVFKLTVPEVANDVKLGSVDAGITWNSTLAQYPELEAVPVSLFDASRMQITITVLRSCRQPTRALHFARYLTARDRGLTTFQAMGYDVVEGDVWAERPELVLFSGGVNRVAISDTLKAFEKREGVTVVTSFNGCGILVGEMRTGKRPDAYFACDASYMGQVRDLFLDQERISETDMVLITAKGNPKNIRSLSDLPRPGVKVAVANPEYSALGGLTRKLLKKAGIYEAVRKNITYGNAPTADYLTIRVATGREDVAIVYRANTVARADKLEVISINNEAARAVQPIAIGKASRHKELTKRLVAAIKSVESRKRFEKAGFLWEADRENDAQ